MLKKRKRNRFGEEKYTFPKRVATVKKLKEVLSEPELQFISNKELYIEECADILLYDDILIKLLLKDKSLMIMGRNLSVSGYNELSITITGEIQGVEWV